MFEFMPAPVAVPVLLVVVVSVDAALPEVPDVPEVPVELLAVMFEQSDFT